MKISSIYIFSSFVRPSVRILWGFQPTDPSLVFFVGINNLVLYLLLVLLELLLLAPPLLQLLLLLLLLELLLLLQEQLVDLG